MDNEVTLRRVQSVCPDCLQRIDARLARHGDEIVLTKHCPDHGAFTTTVWRGTPEFSSWFRPDPGFDRQQQTSSSRCPSACGLCTSHQQRSCTVLVEVTSRCNLHCPVCFANAGTGTTEPALDTVEKMFAQVLEATNGCNLQISGGEPTLREDLVEIISKARQTGFTFIQLNTNGIRLADDPDLALHLRDAGLSSVFLQFDGIDDTPYQVLRGRPLAETKCRAIEHIALAGIGIVLVPTLVYGVNDNQLFSIVRFGLERQPHVRGVHFQPMSYFGRYPADHAPRHITLPEVIHRLAAQSGGSLAIDDFSPPSCEHPLCSFSARYLVHENGQLQRLGKNRCTCTPLPTNEGALTSISVTARQWRGVELQPSPCTPKDDLDRFLHRARTHIFSISGMAFQDCWSMNLERLRNCCIHVATRNGRLIPFCSYNLTSRDGRPLHRRLS